MTLKMQLLQYFRATTLTVIDHYTLVKQTN